MTEEFIAWAIDTRSTEGHGLLGRYYFASILPHSLEGCRVALFKTRETARRNLKRKFENYTPSDWKPRVIRVKVVIEEVKA